MYLRMKKVRRVKVRMIVRARASKWMCRWGMRKGRGSRFGGVLEGSGMMWGTVVVVVVGGGDDSELQ